jgi:hypothetical protein
MAMNIQGWSMDFYFNRGFIEDSIDQGAWLKHGAIIGRE